MAAELFKLTNIAGAAVRRFDYGSKPLIVWNSNHCPFAQRLIIALQVKNIPYEKRDVIDLYNGKPPEMLIANPRGLVPTIDDNGRYVFESMICVEYVDELWKSPDNIDLLPSDPYKRVTAKLAVDEISKNIIPNFYSLLVKQSQDEQNQAKEKLLSSLKYVSSNFMGSGGPFLNGGKLGYADICLAPFAHRFDVALPHFRQFSIPTTEEYQNYNNWWSTIKDDPVMKNTSQTKEQLIVTYEKYAKNTAVSKVSQAINSGSGIP